MDGWVHIVAVSPWAAEPAAVEYAKGVYELRDQVTNNFVPHLLAHSVMLHGLTPDEILPRAAMTFLPAAWSISLEWQFYLLAPIILAMLDGSFRTIILMMSALFLFLLFKLGLLSHYSINSTITANLQYFFAGNRVPFDVRAHVCSKYVTGP